MVIGKETVDGEACLGLAGHANAHPSGIRAFPASDEGDARGLECAEYRRHVVADRHRAALLEIADRRQADAGGISGLFLAPAEKTTSSATGFWRQHAHHIAAQLF